MEGPLTATINAVEIAHSPTLVATQPEGERLAAGARAGEYVVDRFLGAGAMGEVYAGRHPVIDKRVAIKVLRRELAASAEAADRFVREAKAAGQVDHPGVVDVFGFGRLDDGRLYLVMDLVDGDPLRARLAKGPLPVDDALAILAAIADALDAAHARGVIHRDLKPDNIVMAGSTPKVLDFGLAKLLAPGAEAGPGTLTGRGSWLGTPGYMAPEQWAADGAGPASDRYALGVIAFELLAGQLPFAASNVPQMMEQHFRASVPPLTSRGGATTAFDAVLRRALAKGIPTRGSRPRARSSTPCAPRGPASARPGRSCRRPPAWACSASVSSPRCSRTAAAVTTPRPRPSRPRSRPRRSASRRTRPARGSCATTATSA